MSKCPHCEANIELRFNSQDRHTYAGTSRAFDCGKCGTALRVGFPTDPELMPQIEPITMEDEIMIKGIKDASATIQVADNKYQLQQLFKIQPGKNTVGRKDDIALECPITTTDCGMSRKHCMIEMLVDKEGHTKFTLMNASEGRNTITLNGDFIDAADEVYLQNGDKIGVSQAILLFSIQIPHLKTTKKRGHE